jgi:hypothetical protein
MVLFLIIRPDQEINKTLSALSDFAVQNKLQKILPVPQVGTIVPGSKKKIS